MARSADTYRGARRNEARESRTPFKHVIFDTFQAVPKGKAAKELREKKRTRFATPRYVPVRGEITKYFPHQSTREMARRRAQMARA